MTSVNQQLDECRQEARRRGLEVICELWDNDLSAFTGKPRPAYMKLLGMIRDGELDAVIVWEQSRLTRRPLELEEYLDAVESQNPIPPTYIHQSGDLHLDAVNGRMVARIKAAVDRQEVEQLIARTKRGMRARAVQGLPAGGPRPFGFEEDKVTHNPVEAAAIVGATEAILAGESVMSITREWKALGLKTSRDAKTFTTALVRQILKRPRNAGLMKHAGEILGRATWDPIVSVERWNACVMLLEDPARKVTPGNQPAYLGSYVFQCGTTIDGEECGGLVKTGRSGKYATRVYTCSAPRTKVDGVTVPHVTASVELVDEYVGSYLVRALDFAGFGVPRGPVVVTDTVPTAELFEALERKQAMLTRQWMTNAITDKVYEENTAILVAQREQATAQLAKAAPVRRLGDELSDVAGELDVWKGLSLARQRAMVSEIATVTILPKGSGSKAPIGERIRIALDLSEWEADVTSDPSSRVAGRRGGDTAIGALLTCEDCVCEDTISAGGRAPIGWAEYARSVGFGGGCGSGRRTRR